MQGIFDMLRTMSRDEWKSAREISNASGVPLVTTYGRLRGLVEIGIVERSGRLYQEGKPHVRPIHVYRRTIIFKDERKKAQW